MRQEKITATPEEALGRKARGGIQEIHENLETNFIEIFIAFIWNSMIFCVAEYAFHFDWKAHLKCKRYLCLCCLRLQVIAVSLAVSYWNKWYTSIHMFLTEKKIINVMEVVYIPEEIFLSERFQTTIMDIYCLYRSYISCCSLHGFCISFFFP